MLNKLKIDSNNKSLNDSQIVKEYTDSFKRTIANENLINYSRRLFDTSIGLEDLAFVATKVKELTLEQKALMQVGMNIAVAGTNIDLTTITNCNKATEDLKEDLIMESNSFITKTTEDFTEIWNNVLLNITSLNSILEFNIDKVRLLKERVVFIQQIALEIGQLIKIQNLSQFLTTNKDTMLSLSDFCNKRDFLNNDLDNIARTSFKDIKTVIKEGLGVFGSTSSKVATETFNRLNFSILKLGKESIVTSNDGLVTNIESDNKFLSLDKTNKDIGFILTVESQTLDYILKEVHENLNFLLKYQNMLESLNKDNLFTDINKFISMVNSLLSNGSVYSETKTITLNYCNLFLESINIFNYDISCMINNTLFINAYNELINNILDQLKNEGVNKNE